MPIGEIYPQDPEQLFLLFFSIRQVPSVSCLRFHINSQICERRWFSSLEFGKNPNDHSASDVTMFLSGWQFVLLLLFFSPFVIFDKLNYLKKVVGDVDRIHFHKVVIHVNTPWNHSILCHHHLLSETFKSFNWHLKISFVSFYWTF